MGADSPAWVVDADAASRLAVLEAELAGLYEGLQARAPDDETAAVLERLASAARSRAQVFREAAALGEASDASDALGAWIEATSRFEAASAEAAGDGPELEAFHESVQRLGRYVDVLLVVAAQDLQEAADG